MVGSRMCTEAEQGVRALLHGQRMSWGSGYGVPWASGADSGTISVVEWLLGTKPFSSGDGTAPGPSQLSAVLFSSRDAWTSCNQQLTR